MTMTPDEIADLIAESATGDPESPRLADRCTVEVRTR